MGWYRADVLGARVVFTDRRGGVSAPPFDTLNLRAPDDGTAEADRDDLAAVAENRRRAVAAVADRLTVDDWVPLRQVHGTVVAQDADVPRGSPPVDADAVVVRSVDRIGAVLVADCAPIALVVEGAVAAVHAGWRGLLDGVIESVVRILGGAPEAAVLGPCIHPCCYEFGRRDLETMVERFGSGVRGTTTSGAPALDVPAVVRSALREVGAVRVSEVDVCTSCSPDYFSHRRDGSTGRQGLLVGLVP